MNKVLWKITVANFRSAKRKYHVGNPSGIQELADMERYIDRIQKSLNDKEHSVNTDQNKNCGFFEKKIADFQMLILLKKSSFGS